MSEIANIDLDEARDMAYKLCQSMDSKPIPTVQAALMLAYVTVAGALDDIPKEHKVQYMIAMIQQGMQAIPPVVEAIRKMEPEQIDLITLPVQGTS